MIQHRLSASAILNTPATDAANRQLWAFLVEGGADVVVRGLQARDLGADVQHFAFADLRLTAIIRSLLGIRRSF